MYCNCITFRNQIHGLQLDVYAMKIESTVVEMFCIAKKMLFYANMEERFRDKRKFG
jgi:hypothetical protein